MRRIILLLILVLLLAGCATSGGNPADTVKQYLQAKITSDRDTITRLLCSEMENQLEREVNAFATVRDARLDNATCTKTAEDTVTCSGDIVATYGTEDTSFPLGAYRVVQENGEWKWCGAQ